MEFPNQQNPAVISHFVDLARCDFSFSALLNEQELTQSLNPKADLSAPVLDLCFSAWNALRDFGDITESCVLDGTWSKEQSRLSGLLDNLVVYLGRILARFQLGEWPFDSEPAMCRFREEAREVLRRVGHLIGADLLLVLLKRTSLPY